MKIEKMLLNFLIVGLLNVEIEVIPKLIFDNNFKTIFCDDKCSFSVICGCFYLFIIGCIINIFIRLINIKNKDPDPLWFRSLVGMCGIICITFIVNYICNKIFNINLWDYNNYPLNMIGCISILYLPIWYFMSMGIIWFDDYINKYIF